MVCTGSKSGDVGERVVFVDEPRIWENRPTLTRWARRGEEAFGILIIQQSSIFQRKQRAGIVAPLAIQSGIRRTSGPRPFTPPLGLTKGVTLIFFIGGTAWHRLGTGRYTSPNVTRCFGHDPIQHCGSTNWDVMSMDPVDCLPPEWLIWKSQTTSSWWSRSDGRVGLVGFLLMRSERKKYKCRNCDYAV